MIPSKAAMAAGYAAGTSTTHFETDPEIIARIAELMDEHTAQRDAQRTAAIEAAKVVGQMTGVTRAWVIQKLAENAQMAQQAEQFKESNAALELIGKDFGMFSGGSDEENAGGVPKSFDMDKLDALLNQSTDALVPEALTAVEQSKVFGEDTALELIQGQVRTKRLDEDRKFITGSETDIALTAEAEPDEPDDTPFPADDFSEPTDED